MSYYGFTFGLIFIGSCALSMCIYKIIKNCNLIEYDSDYDTDESNYESEYSSDFNETDIEEDYEEDNSIDFQDNINNPENINNFTNFEIYIIGEKKEEEHINYNSRILIF